MLGVGGDAQHRLRDCAEEQVVDHSRILESKLRERIWQGEDYVVVGNRQQLLLSRFEPLGFCQRLALGTVTVPTRNGELSITCLMGSNFLWVVGCRKCLIPLTDQVF